MKGIFRELNNLFSWSIIIGFGLIFFDINYYLMTTLPGTRDNMCMIGAGFTFWNVFFSIVLSFLIGVLIAGMIVLFKQNKPKKMSAGTLSGAGMFLGMLSVFCVWCTVPVISLFGLSMSLSFFMNYSVYVKVISIVLMVVGLHYLNKQLEQECAVCRID